MKTQITQNVLNHLALEGGFKGGPVSPEGVVALPVIKNIII